VCGIAVTVGVVITMTITVADICVLVAMRTIGVRVSVTAFVAMAIGMRVPMCNVAEIGVSNVAMSIAVAVNVSVAMVGRVEIITVRIGV